MREWWGVTKETYIARFCKKNTQLLILFAAVSILLLWLAVRELSPDLRASVTKAYTFPASLLPGTSPLSFGPYYLELEKNITKMDMNSTQIEFLVPEEFLHRRLRRIRLAQSGDIEIATFIFLGDATGSQFAAELMAAARKGITVKVLIDGVAERADRPSPYDLYQRLADSGVRVKIYRSTRGLRLLESIFNRTLHKRLHSKIFRVGDHLILGSGNVWNYTFDIQQKNQVPGIEHEIELKGAIVNTAAGDFSDLWESDENHELKGQGKSNKAQNKVSEFIESHRMQEIPDEQEGLKTVIQAAKDLQYVKDMPLRIPPNWEKEEMMLWTQSPEDQDSPQANPWVIRSLTEEEGFHRALNYPGTVAEILRVMMSAKISVDIVTPYFDLVAPFRIAIKKLLKKGIPVRVVTNSYQEMENEYPALAYCYQRNLKKYSSFDPKFEIWETSYHNQLHSKFIVIDENSQELSRMPMQTLENTKSYLGSFNFSQVSALYSIENGIITCEPKWVEGRALSFSKILATQFQSFLDDSIPAVQKGEVKVDSSPCRGSKKCGIFVGVLPPCHVL